ncbi:MAG: acyltransferase family protein [Pseudomonadota bacterium]
MSIQYIRHLDGLRALAVLLVIAEHLDLSGIPGGFVGVDIFFVLSGFLVTRILLKEVDTRGAIALGSFYWRRAWRLLPSVFVTILVSALFATLLFSDDNLRNFTWSAIYGVFSLTNVYFWSEVDYFDTAASTKPLLHLWSLGVEEQFYLVWPLLIGAAFCKLGPRRGFWIIAGVSAASFGLNIAAFEAGGTIARLAPSEGFWSGFQNPASTAFYWFPFRVFEFGIGALLASNRIYRAARSRWQNELLVVIGLAACLYPAITLTGDAVFPYYNALLPCIGAACLILGGAGSTLSSAFFETTPARFIGKLSYSLYLVHWPAIVFYKAYFGDALGWGAISVLIILMAALACALYFGVETRFRHWAFVPSRSHSDFSAGKRGAMIAAVATVVAVAWAAPMIPNRVPADRQTTTKYEWFNAMTASYCREFRGGVDLRLVIDCQTPDPDAPTLVVWGDSHASHLTPGLATVFPGYNIKQAALMSCTPISGFLDYVRRYESAHARDICVQRNRDLMAWAGTLDTPHIFILSGYKRSAPQRAARIFDHLVDELEHHGHRAIIMGDFIQPGVHLADCMAVPDYVMSDARLLERCRPDEVRVADELAYNRVKAAKLAPDRYIRVSDLQCPDGQCRFWTDDGELLYRDDDHLSIIGAITFIRELKTEIETRFYPVVPASS